MPDHSAGQAVNVLDIAKRSKQLAFVARKDDIHFGIREDPLQFGNQRGEQQQVTEPMIGPANKDSTHFCSKQVFRVPQAPVAGLEQWLHCPTNNAPPDLVMVMTVKHRSSSAHHCGFRTLVVIPQIIMPLFEPNPDGQPSHTPGPRGYGLAVAQHGPAPRRPVGSDAKFGVLVTTRSLQGHQCPRLERITCARALSRSFHSARLGGTRTKQAPHFYGYIQRALATA